MREKKQVKRMNFRVDETTDAILRKKAAEAGMSLSAFVIGSAVGKKIVSFGELKNVTAELKRIGNNLNQLVVLSRQGKIHTVHLENIQTELEAMHRELSRVLKGGG